MTVAEQLTALAEWLEELPHMECHSLRELCDPKASVIRSLAAVTLSPDEIEQRLKGVLGSAFNDGMVTENGGRQLFHRIMCSLKNDDPESLTFEELTSYMPATGRTVPAEAVTPGSVKALAEAAEASRRLLADALLIEYKSGFASNAYIEQYVAKLEAALAPFKPTPAPAEPTPVTPDELADLLLLIDEEHPLEVIAGWTQAQRDQVADWAGAVVLEANDNDVKAPPKPDFMTR